MKDCFLAHRSKLHNAYTQGACTCVCVYIYMRTHTCRLKYFISRADDFPIFPACRWEKSSVILFTSCAQAFQHTCEPEVLDYYKLAFRTHRICAIINKIHLERVYISHTCTCRTLGHNGEINTLLGNINWMRAREAIMDQVRTKTLHTCTFRHTSNLVYAWPFWRQ
jgi:hypothetical protein